MILPFLQDCMLHTHLHHNHDRLAEGLLVLRIPLPLSMILP